MTKAFFYFRRKLRAVAVQLAISSAVATIVAIFVFLLWYPGEFRKVTGGQDLFLTIVFVDLIMGPFIIFIVYSERKSSLELRRDLALIALLQICVLGYGIYAIYEGRPIALVFEVDRLRVISAPDVVKSELPFSSPKYRALPKAGPWLLSTRVAVDGKEKIEAVDLALQGFDLGQRPIFWQPYENARAQILERSRPISTLFNQYPDARSDIESRLSHLDLTSDSVRFLPALARSGGWVAIIDPAGEVAGFAQYDGFF